jgi:hypothetical protein
MSCNFMVRNQPFYPAALSQKIVPSKPEDLEKKSLHFIANRDDWKHPPSIG